MLWAQTYALQNRDIMQARFNFVDQGSEVQRINCHHNIAQREEHNGRRVWVGTIQTRQGDYGVIPGSMGDRGFVAVMLPRNVAGNWLQPGGQLY